MSFFSSDAFMGQPVMSSIGQPIVNGGYMPEPYRHGYQIIGGRASPISMPMQCTPSPMLQYAASLLPPTVYPRCPPLTNNALMQTANNGMMQTANNGMMQTTAPAALYTPEMFTTSAPITEQLTYLNGKPASLEENVLGAPVYQQKSFSAPQPAGQKSGMDGEGIFPDQFYIRFPDNGRPFELEDIDDKDHIDGAKSGFARRSRLAARFNIPPSPTAPSLNTSV